MALRACLYNNPRTYAYLLIAMIPAFPGCFPNSQSGAPAGLDTYSSTPGSKTWYVDGKRFAGSWNQNKAQCLERCSAANKGYKFYMLHDSTACFCAKQTPTSTRTGPADSNCAKANAVWLIQPQTGNAMRWCMYMYVLFIHAWLSMHGYVCTRVILCSFLFLHVHRPLEKRKGNQKQEMFRAVVE